MVIAQKLARTSRKTFIWLTRPLISFGVTLSSGDIAPPPNPGMNIEGPLAPISPSKWKMFVLTALYPLALTSSPRACSTNHALDGGKGKGEG